MPKKPAPRSSTGPQESQADEQQSGEREPAAPSLAEFETSLKQLEALVETLEKGELGLDEGLKLFEQGVALARSCQQTLEQAELRVQTVMENHSLDPR